MSDLELRVEPYDGPAAEALITAVQQEYVVRYGGPDETPVDPADFTPPAGRFLVGYRDGEPVACGGVRVNAPGVAEVKRMFVAPGTVGAGCPGCCSPRSRTPPASSAAPGCGWRPGCANRRR